MEKDKEQTRVLFVWLESEEVEGYRRTDSTQNKTLKELVALFPDMVQAENEIDCYAHTGQHGVASVDLLDECKEATEEEYKNLKEELESLGYNLDVLNGDGFHITNKDYSVTLFYNQEIDTIQGKIDEPEVDESCMFWSEKKAKEYARELIEGKDVSYFVQVAKNNGTLKEPFYEEIITLEV